jgi:hypothetical protein
MLANFPQWIKQGLKMYDKLLALWDQEATSKKNLLAAPRRGRRVPPVKKYNGLLA